MSLYQGNSTWSTDVYLVELTDAVIGGPDGVANLGVKNLADRTAWLKQQYNDLALAKAALASPDFTGSPLAPTPPSGDNSRRIATTGFVQGELNTARPFETVPGDIKPNGAQSLGTKNTVARGDHVHPTDQTRAPLASPIFTGQPSAPTPPSSDNSQRLATTEFVKQSIPDAADLSGLAPKNSPVFTGAPMAPTPTAGDSSKKIATTEYVQQALPNMANYATKASPVFTGTPTAPTPPSSDNSTRIATTAMVQSSVQSAVGSLNIPAAATFLSASVSWENQIVKFAKNSGFSSVSGNGQFILTFPAVDMARRAIFLTYPAILISETTTSVVVSSFRHEPDNSADGGPGWTVPANFSITILKV